MKKLINKIIALFKKKAVVVEVPVKKTVKTKKTKA